MDFLRKIWLSLGQSTRGVIRSAIRAQAERILVEEILPAVSERVTKQLPGSGPLLVGILAEQVDQHIRK